MLCQIHAGIPARKSKRPMRSARGDWKFGGSDFFVCLVLGFVVFVCFASSISPAAFYGSLITKSYNLFPHSEWRTGHAQPNSFLFLFLFFCHSLIFQFCIPNKALSATSADPKHFGCLSRLRRQTPYTPTGWSTSLVTNSRHCVLFLFPTNNKCWL